MSRAEATATYIEHHFYPIPVPHGTKKPVLKGWPSLRLTAADIPKYFNGTPQNVGILLGDEFGTTDVDLDARQAIIAASYLLPETACIFGHDSKPASHCIYRADPPIKSVEYADPLDDAIIVELRGRKRDGSIGHQTVVPPSTHKSGEAIRFVDGYAGFPANVDADTLTRAVAKTAAAAILAKYWPKQGCRHAAFLALAGVLCREGWSVADAEQFHYAIYSVLWTGQEDFAASKSEVRSTFEKFLADGQVTGIPALRSLIDPMVVNTALRWLAIKTPSAPTGGEDVGLEPQNTPSCQIDLLSFGLHDAGNAQRLVALHGLDLRYCHAMKKWLVWDGRRWMVDETGQVRKRAKATMAEFIRQAVQQEKSNAKDFAVASLNENRITALLASAECEIPIAPAQLDTYPFLLNCKNGTLDLKTGELREHRREDYVTKLVHFDYDPDTRCDLFLRSIHRMMGDGPDASDPERERSDRMVEYLQKAFGYALSGDVSEKIVFCFFGGGNNGKTTLLEIIRYVIWEYAAQVLIDSLMVRAHGETNNSMADLADLRGCRFVTTSEAEEGQRLNEGKLKYLSAGMGKIKTCRKYENPIEFLATHKLFMDANHKPIIRGTEQAVWNRLKTVVFSVTLPQDEIDKGLLDKLKAEAPGILTWMVTGFQKMMADGLGDPPEVAEAGEAWRDEMDPLKDFLADCCELAPECYCHVTQLRQAYERWANDNGERFPLSRTRFNDRLEKLGCTQTQHRFEGGHHPERAWKGIKLGAEPNRGGVDSRHL